VVCNHIFKMVKRRRLSKSRSTGLTKKQTVRNKAATLIAHHASPFLPSDEQQFVKDMMSGTHPVVASMKYAGGKFHKHILPRLIAHGEKADADAARNRSRDSSGPPKKRGYLPPSQLGIPSVGNRLFRDISSLPSSVSMSRSRSSSFNSSYSKSVQMGGGPATRFRKSRVFPTKKKPSKAQRIISTITPTRSLTYQFNGVVESQQGQGFTGTSGGAPTPFSCAEFAYGANTSLPIAVCGIYGHVAQDKADPGCNAWVFQTLFHGSVIDQLQRMCQVASDAPTAITNTANLVKNNIFYISSYSVVHTLHNPSSSPMYMIRYEMVPRANLKNVSDLFYTMQHVDGEGDNVVSPYNTSAVIASARSANTPDVNPNEFPMFTARFRVLRKRKFILQPGQTIHIPYAGKLNKKIDMNEYNVKRRNGQVSNYNSYAPADEWGTDATFMAKGLTKILAYQAYGIPAVQGTTGSSTIGSVVSNRVTTTPVQFILRSTTKYRCHGAVDTAKRYATFRLNDDLETATSAVSGIPGSSTHAITVTNQI